MGHPLRSVRRLVLSTGAAALLAIGLSACSPGLSITTNPALYPATFRTDIPDYVSRCDADDPVEVAVTAPEGTTVSIDGQPARSGTFTTRVTRAVGQRFSIVVDAARTSTHYVRCLPADFPAWEAERSGDPQAKFYLTTPIDTPLAQSNNYTAIFDTNGVPIWWLPRRNTVFATTLPGRHIAWTRVFGTGDATEVRLDGSVVRTITPEGPGDFHELLRLPNGNYVMGTAEHKTGVDLRPTGGPANATIVDHVFQELTPAGQVVWKWRTSAHIPITETTATWRNDQNRFDPYHFNSIEWTGDGYIVSYRHLDAIYKIDRASKNITWKLGGTLRGESLAVRNDPVFASGGGFSGQHDARKRPDGTVTLHDNGTFVGRPPRSVRYRIDLAGRTATLVGTITDPVAQDSLCCGSTRTTPGGNRVTGWGGTAGQANHMTENEPGGTRVFRLTFPSAGIYRAVPLEEGDFYRAELRAGMDAQYSSK